MTEEKKFSFDKALMKIEEINKWFEGNEYDLDTALEKYKEASELIAECKKHLTRVENEFNKVDKAVAEDIHEEAVNIDLGPNPEEDIPF